MTVIRGTSLQGFAELVTELGVDPSALLARARLRAEVVGDHDSFIDYRSVITVLEFAAQATGTPDFGRRLAQRQGLEILGPVGVAARTAPTVAAAASAITRYLAVYSPALRVTIDPRPGRRHAWFDWRIVAERIPPHRQAAELGIGVSVQIFRLLAGQDFTPYAVSFRHQPAEDVSNYADYFGCPVDFGTDSTGFLFDQKVLAQRLDADSAVHQVVQDYLDSIAAPEDTQLDGSVRHLIRRMISTGGLNIKLVADHLAVHPRTLQRNLAAHGTSFGELVEDVRKEEMQRYLRDTHLPLSQVAGLLGYSEQSVLTRSCRRWFGVSPTAVRAAAGSGALA
ncbi:AraC family transcriptional regulator ligand-binding domain-containing protein [Rhodococcus sp. NPDC056960]|uniref:AraC family transcriptional regulator n=1 Tax=Rhodococcus sp. NPDC056960 TaxID=3345982 RepID=UPI00362B9F66